MAPDTPSQSDAQPEADLIPVAHDPFVGTQDVNSNLLPVDHDPFNDPLENAHGTAPTGNVAEAVAAPVEGAIKSIAAQPSFADRMQAYGDSYNASVASGMTPGEAVMANLDKGLDVASAMNFTGSTGGIKAYHGSPHDFDAFDTSKIGTGEGAQAYGHGLYFAENPETARNYREKLAGTPTTQFGGSDYAFSEAQKAIQAYRQDNPINGYLDSIRGDVMKSVSNHVVEDHGADITTPKYINDVVSSYPTDVQDQIREWANQAHAIVKPQLSVTAPGKMYEVNINADPEHFLDWDKPLSEQPHVMQNAPQLLEAAKEEAYNRALSATNKPRADELWSMVKDPSLAPGGFAMQSLERNSAPDKSVASSALQNAGIPGIKYLDQGSRGSASGTHNYVVFNDRIVNIARKYGIGALVAGGVSHFSKPSDQKDASQ